ncbi:hypothetical protein BJX63DRAFT_426676 [Aspergillus granulosus]|uniref:Uncharacterized protein n=1 Tax=Aspergillus granulosus TaxID=176169 RepID=A0ABR4GSS3_9EURO
MEHQIFEKIPTLRVIICRQCQHGVHPKEVDTYLQQKHFIKLQESKLIAEAIPHVLEEPLPILPIHTNGLLCQRGPASNPCQVITTSINFMRNYWKKVYGWSQHQYRGRIPAAERVEQQNQVQQSFRTVAWQQVFPTRKNSHLVHIQSRDPAPDDPPAPRTQIEDIVAWIKARAVEDEREAASQATEAEQLHDANSWLRITCWAQFATMVANEDLVAVVATPNPELDDPVSRATRVVWETMEQLARWSQQTVKHCSNGIRMLAVSMMPNQTPYQPLRAYMDEKSIQDHMRPWQQILLFIIRTQTDWPWQQQKPGWLWPSRESTMQLIEQPIKMPIPQPIPVFIITPIKTACLEFCIKLLNQKTKVYKYKSLLCDSKNYSSIISRILKTGNAADNQLAIIIEDKGPLLFMRSNNAMPISWISWHGRMPFQAGVDWIVLLDWHIFGIKIYYNTTAPGHII